MMKKIILFTFAALVVLFGTIFVIRLVSGEDDWICVNNQWVKHGNPSVPVPKTGCVETKTTVTATPTQSAAHTQQVNKPSKEQITAALAAKNNWLSSNLVVSVTVTEGDYAKGMVNFKDENSGGLWFAAKVNGVWKIVYDGNGIIGCESLTNYPSFPTTLIPQCFDQKTSAMVTR